MAKHNIKPLPASGNKQKPARKRVQKPQDRMLQARLIEAPADVLVIESDSDQEITDLLFENPPNYQKVSRIQHRKIAKITQVKQKFEAKSVRKSQRIAYLRSELAITTMDLNANRHIVQELTQELTELKDKNLCFYCATNQNDTTTTCGHLACNECMTRIYEKPLAQRKCPKCRNYLFLRPIQFYL